MLSEENEQLHAQIGRLNSEMELENNFMSSEELEHVRAEHRSITESFIQYNK